MVKHDIGACVVTCDKCKKIITKDFSGTWYAGYIGQFCEKKGFCENIKQTKDFDFCPECYEKFKKFMED